MEKNHKKKTVLAEPDYETACQWWPNIPSAWTPIEWKDHLLRFNIFWNGTLFAPGAVNNHRTQKWQTDGIQLTVLPAYHSGAMNGKGMLADAGIAQNDDNMVLLGWHSCDAPVLWSRNVDECGIQYETSVFAHISGGDPVKSGDEPLFAWMRATCAGQCAPFRKHECIGFMLMIHAPHAITSMEMRHSPLMVPSKARYPRELKAEGGFGPHPQQGLRIVEPDGRIRLAVAPSGNIQALEFNPPQPDDTRAAYRLFFKMPASAKAHVDILIPYYPVEKGILEAELDLGYDSSLRQANKYWRGINRCRTRFDIPEKPVRDIMSKSLNFSHILAERDPATGKYCKISGSWTYSNLWSTPGSMDFIMLLDTLGHHKTVEKYLDIFRDEQGTVTPPGAAYTAHRGYLSTPALYKSIDWVTDNGAILYTLSMHGMLCGDPAYARKFTDCIIKSCEWIRDMRALRGHGGAEGILPPAVATDKQQEVQCVWNDGWNYKGLIKAVAFLRATGNPRASEFAREAAEYKKCFIAALRRETLRMPVWTDSRGRRHRLVPYAISSEDPDSDPRMAFYLDGGPLFLVFAGLLDARDRLMRDTILWFREAPSIPYTGGMPTAGRYRYSIMRCQAANRATHGTSSIPGRPATGSDSSRVSTVSLQGRYHAIQEYPARHAVA